LKPFFNLLLVFIGVIIINIFSQFYFFRIDLTEEKRYTIQSVTKKILKELDDEILIKVYLEGDLPPMFQRLQKNIRETLDEFKTYGGVNVQYRFINPLNLHSNKDKQNAFLREIAQKGIIPTNLPQKIGDKMVDKLIYPSAMLVYKNVELPIMLFKTIDQSLKGAPSSEQILNQSVENVEYNLISAIRQITQKKRPKIGFLEGHGELDAKERNDLVNTLQLYYDIYNVNLLQSEVLEGLDAIIVAKPDSTFSDKNKYKIDQFIMRGGKAVFLLDGAGVYMDSVIRDKGSFSFPYNHNLTDLLFRYGIRINSVLIRDEAVCTEIPLVVGNMGDKPQIKAVPWKYYPLLNTFGKHPIVKNLSPVQARFVNTLDTVKAKNISKIPLLFTSKYSRQMGTPVFVTFNEAKENADFRKIPQQSYPVAYLLEGKFLSMYAGRSQSSNDKEYVSENKSPNKILVCADGDIARNEIIKGRIFPLGFDPMFKRQYGNKDFLLNAIDYLLDDKGVMATKNKEITLRPLDKLKTQDERFYWQVFNVGLPLVMLVLFGVSFYFWRKNAFGK
jgi:ABC-2 type transport system permease protein